MIWGYITGWFAEYQFIQYYLSLIFNIFFSIIATKMMSDILLYFYFVILGYSRIVRNWALFRVSPSEFISPICLLFNSKKS